jgi:hypothetical protein
MNLLEEFDRYYSYPVKTVENLENLLKELKVYESCQELVERAKLDARRYANKMMEDSLFNAHPMLFRTTLLGHYGDHKNYQRMRGLGLEAPIGWYNIIDDMCNSIEEVVRGTDVQPVFVCIKEKFGTMRPWLEECKGLTDEKMKLILEILRKAEEASAETCQVCGKPGKVRRGNWTSTLCDEHAKEDNDEDQG